MNCTTGSGYSALSNSAGNIGRHRTATLIFELETAPFPRRLPRMEDVSGVAPPKRERAMKPLAGVLAEPGNGRGVMAEEFEGVPAAVKFGRWRFNPGVLGLVGAPCLGVFMLDACLGPRNKKYVQTNQLLFIPSLFMENMIRYMIFYYISETQWL